MEARAILVAAAILIARFLVGGRWAGVGADSGGFVVDRFTGTVQVCSLFNSLCRRVEIPN
jgi:hypothetical protein